MPLYNAHNALHVHLEGKKSLLDAYQMLEKKNAEKRVSKSGVGTESVDREKGIKITKMVFKLLWSEISRAIIIHVRGKGIIGKLRQRVH